MSRRPCSDRLRCSSATARTPCLPGSYHGLSQEHDPRLCRPFTQNPYEPVWTRIARMSRWKKAESLQLRPLTDLRGHVS
jgi:hypothetical protein